MRRPIFLKFHTYQVNTTIGSSDKIFSPFWDPCSHLGLKNLGFRNAASNPWLINVVLWLFCYFNISFIHYCLISWLCYCMKWKIFYQKVSVDTSIFQNEKLKRWQYTHTHHLYYLNKCNIHWDIVCIRVKQHLRPIRF